MKEINQGLEVTKKPTPFLKKNIEVTQDDLLPFSKQLYYLSLATSSYFSSEPYQQLSDEKRNEARLFFFSILKSFGELAIYSVK